MEGCTRQAMKGGVCVTHGARRRLCTTEGCRNQSVVGGVCVRHGAKLARTAANTICVQVKNP